MNDRLADLGGETPSWALDTGGDNDIETGTNPLSNQPQEGSNFSGPTNGADEDFEWASQTNENENKVSDAAELQQKYMDAFFKDIETIKSDIDTIMETSKRITEMNDRAVLTVSEVEESELSRELSPLVRETNKSAKRTKNMLELLKEENAKFKKEKTVKDSDMRVRENLCNTLTRKFIDEMKFYQSQQQKYKSDLNKKAVRQIKLVKPDATPEEIEKVMNSDGGRTEAYQQYVLAGGVNETIKKTYNDVAGKYQDVITLEQSVAELHQMFLDFALLTMQQGELLDQIEYNVKGAADYVEEANLDVHQAIEYQKSARKKQCWIIILVLVVALVIGISIGLFG